MSAFRVFDLLGQARAIDHHVHGWPPDAVLLWLRQFGPLEAMPLPSGRTYYTLRDQQVCKGSSGSPMTIVS